MESEGLSAQDAIINMESANSSLYSIEIIQVGMRCWMSSLSGGISSAFLLPTSFYGLDSEGA